MDRKRKRFSWRRVLLLLLFALVLGGLSVVALLEGLQSHNHRASPRVACMNNLRQIGGLMRGRMAEERMERVPGSAFLKQMAPDIRDEDLVVFLCPKDSRYSSLLANQDDLVKHYREDWRTAPCSYRGPNAELLAEAFAPDAPRLILACDHCGPAGSDPWHETGVVVLFNDGRVDFILWEEMEGYDGGPVPVGPGSPDPRFRRLVP
jgi:hypothetical protein